MPDIRTRSKRKREKLIQERHAAITLVQSFLTSSEDAEGHLLRAWIRHFDKDYSFSISSDEFCDGMDRLGFVGDPDEIFRQLDMDGSGEITLDEVNPDLAALWMRFHKWCSSKFEDPADMIRSLGDGSSDFITRQSFHENLSTLGWTGALLTHQSFIKRQSFLELGDDEADDEVFLKDLMFDGLRTSAETLVAKDLDWLVVDKARQNLRMQARHAAVRRQAERSRKRYRQAAVVVQFRNFLRQKVSGSLIRAWRRSLDSSKSMRVSQAELWKAAKDMAWAGDLRMLWKSLDKDGSGAIEIQELDMKSAVLLAEFKAWVSRKYRTTATAFDNLDLHGAGKLHESDFVRLCDKAGFKVKKALFQGLDWRGNRCIKPDDLEFLDTWRCPAYLTCKPNDEDAKAFKIRLVDFYHSNLNGWKNGLDRQYTNRVTWSEFASCCQRIHFPGDQAGVWRSLTNGAAYMSYHDLDPEGDGFISALRAWADEEFGDLASALQVFDEHNSGQLTFSRFQKAVLSYCYTGALRRTFNALDLEGLGMISCSELAFIDEWKRVTASTDKLDDTPACMVQVEAKLDEEVKEAAKASQLVHICSPRILKLAQPKVPQALTPRPPSPGARTMRGIRIGALKDEILNFRKPQPNSKVWSESVVLSFPVDIVSIKEKTQALRNRTLDLLDRDTKEKEDTASAQEAMRTDARVHRLSPLNADMGIKAKTQALRLRSQDLADKDKDLQRHEK